MAKRVTLITGDGVGPELAEAAKRCIDATGVDIEWDVQEAGIEVYEKEGTPLPDRVIQSIRENRVALKAPVTTPVGSGFRSVNVALRQELDLYACLRPCKWYPGVRSRDEGVDLVVVRENTEGLYAGIEYDVDETATLELCDFVQHTRERVIRRDSAISLKPISESASRRIVQFAFEYARKNGRKKVTAVHKANIMKFSDGLFLRVARNVAENYPDIEFEDRIVDNMCMQLVQKPELYDVMVMPNLYGDILSDLCAGLVGGLGVAPGANIGDYIGLFEATHGTAPKYADKDMVNPGSLILSAVMMLDYLGWGKAGQLIERAIEKTIGKKTVTYDLARQMKGAKKVGTSEYATQIIKNL